MRRTVCINILAFNLLDERKYPKMHSCFSVYDKETGCQLTSQLEIHFLELKKFQSKSVKEMNRMERWAAYFSPVTPEEEIAELAAEDEDIRAAVEMEKMFTQDEVARRKYDLAEKFRRDQAAHAAWLSFRQKPTAKCQPWAFVLARLKRRHRRTEAANLRIFTKNSKEILIYCRSSQMSCHKIQ